MIGIREFAVLFSNVERNAGGSAIQPIFSGGLCANLSYEVANPSTKGNCFLIYVKVVMVELRFHFSSMSKSPLFPLAPKQRPLPRALKGIKGSFCDRIPPEGRAADVAHSRL
jgi:hypothetical protein